MVCTRGVRRGRAIASTASCVRIAAIAATPQAAIDNATVFDGKADAVGDVAGRIEAARFSRAAPDVRSAKRVAARAWRRSTLREEAAARGEPAAGLATR